MWTLWSACRAVSWSGDGPAIERVSLDPTPNPLAARVTFETSTEAEGIVQFGRGDALEWQVAGAGGRTEHEIVVFGLHADRAHRLEIVARDADGGESRTEALTFRTGPVLDGLAANRLVALPEATPGWTLMDLFVDGDAVDRAVMVDAEGQIVWLFEGDRAGAGATDVSVTPDGTVLVGGSVAVGAHPVELDLAGEVLWEGAKQPDFEHSGFQHHHLEKLSDGTYLGLVKDVRDGQRGDRIVRWNADGSERWSWSTWDWWPLLPGLAEQSHLNWVGVDDPWVYVSDYVRDLVTKLDGETGAPQWSLGWDGDFALAEGDFFEQQHAPEWGADGLLYVYDNGERGGATRVVAYSLDEGGRTAAEVWSFDGGAQWGWFTGWWGDVDRLASGNVLVSAGNLQVRRAMEVTPDETVVWAIEWPMGVGFYRAERVDPARWGWSALSR